MSVTALALLLTCAPALEVNVDLDAQLVGKAAVDPGRGQSHLLAGVRGGLLTPLGGGVRAGFDVGLHSELLPRVRGTTRVNSVALESTLAPRGIVGWRASWGPLALFPYAFAGPKVGVRFLFLTAFDEVRNNTHPTWALRGGGGLTFVVGRTRMGVEIGGGVGERGLESYGLLTTGLAL